MHECNSCVHTADADAPPLLTPFPLCVLPPVQVFAPFVAAGFVEFVYGGADVGRYCNHHQLVDSVHLTGSEATYNNIVFGSPTVQVRVCIARIGGG